MRVVFTITLPCAEDGSFPDDETVLALLRSFGWEHREISRLANERERLQKYYEEAAKLFEEMPVVANKEKGDVVFYGTVQDDQTHFVITRRVEGQITCRLSQPALNRLQGSVVKMVKQILRS